MGCQVCEAEAVHNLSFIDNLQIPLCRTHLLRIFRRFKRGDKELMRFRCQEICDMWKVRRKHKNRSKVSDEVLKEITELKCAGYSVTSIAQKLSLAKSLVHRYVTRLQDCSQD
jgi:transposase-like protein